MELYKYNIKFTKNGKIISNNWYTFSLTNLIKDLKFINGNELEIIHIKECSL